MTRVRRRYFPRPNTRPAVRARRPLTELISAAEGIAMFDAGIDVGEAHAERDNEYDRGYLAGAKDMMEHLLRERGEDL